MARRRSARPSFVPTVVPLSAATFVLGTVATLGVLSIAGVKITSAVIVSVVTVWILVTIVQTALLLRSLARNLSDPVIGLVDVAERVAEGDLTAHAHAAKDGPLGDLAVAMNQMTESFRSRSDAESARVLELTTLYETSRTLGSTLDLTGLLNTVLDEALGVLEVDVGYVVLRDRATDELELRSRRGASGVPSELLVDGSVTEWVARERRPLMLNPGATATSPSGVIHATLAVPLADSDGAIGVIMVGSTNGHDRFTSDDVRLLSTIANHSTVAIRNVELFASLREAYLGTVRSLAAAIDAKDAYTRGHSERVAEYGTLVAQRMGLSEEEVLALELAAYLHDIGKIGIPEAILRKPGRLDDDEFTVMKSHPIVGATILTPVEFPWPIMPAVRHHHEHFDGHGYPAGLKGPEIPLLARILTVADSFEAMVSDRPYRRGRAHDDALAEIVRCSGTQFDPVVVDAFVEVVGSLTPASEVAAY
jgi:putative nucleotidyltransferase with HDIG domain